MAGFSFLGNMLLTAVTVARSVNALNKAKQNYVLRDGDLTTALANQQAQQKAASDQEATARRDALRRAVARQKAAFGAQGIDTADGSAEAILLGLAEQSAMDAKQQDALDQLRQKALQDNTALQQRKNLLALNQTYDTLRLSSLYSD